MLLLVACFVNDFPMNEGQLRVTSNQLQVGHWTRLAAGGPVLADSSFCAEVRCEVCEDDAQTTCWTGSGEGSVTVDGRCIDVAEGEGSWVFTVDPDCVDATDDRADLVGVPLQDVEVGLEWPMRDLGVAFNAPESGMLVADRDRFPEDTVPSLIRLAGSTRLDVGLWFEGGLVAFDTRELTDLRAERAAVPVAVENRTRLWLTPNEGDLGATGELVGTFRGQDVLLAEFEVVDPESAASLDLVVGLVQDGGPLGALADFRDANDNPLVGMPVEWDTNGEMGVVVDAPTIEGVDAEEQQTVRFVDCVPPDERGGTRELVVRARGNGLEDRVRVSWEGEAEPGDDWQLPPECATEGGCACSTRRAGGSWMLAALGLGVLWRR